MKNLILSLSIFLLACNSQNGGNKNIADKDAAVQINWVPKANTVVASDSIKIPDQLNELYFTIEVIASAQSSKGIYEVLVTYGHNDASTQIIMPDGHVLPEVRRGQEPFTYIIGFHYGADTAFKDYFLVKAGKGKTEMKYLKAYSLIKSKK